MKGKTHKLLSLAMAIVLVVSMCAVIVAPATADVSQPTKPTIGAGLDVIGVPSTYTAMSFATGKALVVGDIVVLTFPTGTVFTAATIAGHVGIAGAATSLAANVVTFTAVGGVPAGTTLTVASGALGVTNPTTPGSKTYTVFTSQEVVKITSAAYTIKGIKVTGGAVLTPTAAPSGTTMTIAGAGYTAGTAVDILLGATIIKGNAGTVETNGTVTVTFTLTAAGNITLKDGAGTTYNAVAVTVLPGLTVTPVSGLAGATITIKGKNFTVFAGDVLTATFGGAALALSSAATTAGATTFSVTATVPATSGGIKKVVVTASVSGDSATANFTCTGQAITISPTTAPVGSTITVSGTGYQASEVVNIAFPGATVAATKTCGTDGSFTTTFKVPAASATGAVTATGATSGAVATATLTIPAATITLDITKGTVGTTVTVTGTSLTISSVYDIVITNTGTGISVVMATVSTDSVGGFIAAANVPSNAAWGVGTIGINPATATAKAFTVLAGTVTVAVDDGLSSIVGKYTKVWGFAAATQSWQLYDVDAASVSDLTSLTRGQGYWLEVSEDCTIVYGGNTYALLTGWNLIGWLG